MRVVLDTNVVASGMLWNGAPRRLLDAARHGAIELFTSTAMLTELAGILERPKFSAKIAASGLGVDQLVEGYAHLCALVRPQAITGIAPDPDDDVVIGTALAAGARLLVSGDKPLLTVREYRGVLVVDVGLALSMIDIPAI